MHKKTGSKEQRSAAAAGARARVEGIIDTITAAHNSGLNVHGDCEGELRDLAGELDVPFLVVYLAAENGMTTEHSLDLDDIAEGMKWLQAHRVPTESLRREPTRRAEWEAKQQPAAKEG